MNQWVRSFFSFNNNFLFVSLFITFCAVGAWIELQDLAITNFDSLPQGIATFQNVDVNKRLSIFYSSLFLAAALFTGCVFLSFLADKRFSRFKYVLAPWNLLSAIGIGFIFFKTANAPQPLSGEFLLAVFATLLLFQVVRYKLRPGFLPVTGISFVWLSALSFSLSFFAREILLVFNSFHSYSLSILYPLVFTVLIVFTTVLSYSPKWNFKRIFRASLPFFVFPLLSVVSDELYLILNQHNIHFLSPDKFYGLGVLLCLVTSVRLFFRGETTSSIKKQFQRIVYPLLLTGIVAFFLYKPFVDQPAEMFELANPANGLMRLLDFQEFPIVQALSAHVLSDVSTGLLYTALNGCNGNVDFIAYDFLVIVLFTLLLYFFFLRIFKEPLFVFSLALFFPFLSFLISDHHSLVFVSVILLFSLSERYSFLKLLAIGCWSAFLLLWKVDVGVTSLAATLFLMGVYVKDNFRKEILLDIGKVSLLLSGVGALAVLSFTWIGQIDILGNFLQAKEYFGANQAHGLPDVVYEHDRFYDYHYFIFPAITVLVFFFLLFRQRGAGPERLRFLHYALLFLTVFYFVQAQRGLVRHSIMEGSDMYMSSFFYLIVGLFIYFLSYNYKHAKYIFVGVLIFMIHNFEYPNSDGRKSNLEESATVFQSSFHLEALDHKVIRVSGAEEFSKNNYSDLKDLLDKNFEKDATFIDLSNTPMLYFYTKRRVPSYFNQYMQNTVTENLQRTNIGYLQGLNVPIAIFSNEPEIWWDCTDGVPNPLRYNIMTEYVYKNYEPLCVLNGHYIWVKKGVAVVVPDEQKVTPEFIKKPKSYDLRKYPYVLARSKQMASGTVRCKSWSNADSILSLQGSDFSDKYNNYLLLAINNTAGVNVEITLKYSGAGVELGSFKFIALSSGKTEFYAIPLSAQYNWLKQDVDAIAITSEQKEKLIFQNISLVVKK